VIVWVIGLSETDGFSRRSAKLVFRGNPESIPEMNPQFVTGEYFLISAS
jgi:hypothetical protein